MDEIHKRLSTLTPEKRKLLEKLLKEKGIDPTQLDTRSATKTTNLIPPPDSSLVGLRIQGSKPPLFFVHPTEGNILCFLDLVPYIDTDHPFYGLQAPGLVNELEPYTSVEELAVRYIEAIKAVDNQGPYILGGFSMGGIVAYEMAQQLH